MNLHLATIGLFTLIWKFGDLRDTRYNPLQLHDFTDTFQTLLYYIVLFRIDILPGFCVIVDLNTQLQSFEDYEAFVLIRRLFSAKPLPRLLSLQPNDAAYIGIHISTPKILIHIFFFLEQNVIY